MMILLRRPFGVSLPGIGSIRSGGVEAERHQLTAGGEAFAGTQEEWDPGPAPVVDLGSHRGHGFGL
jgi:hypothetical protein